MVTPLPSESAPKGRIEPNGLSVAARQPRVDTCRLCIAVRYLLSVINILAALTDNQMSGPLLGSHLKIQIPSRCRHFYTGWNISQNIREHGD